MPNDLKEQLRAFVDAVPPVSADEAISRADTGARNRVVRATHARRRSFSALVALVLVAALVGGILLAVQSGAPSPRWKLVGYLSSLWHLKATSGSQGDFSLTCPTTSTCYAINPNLVRITIEVTTDGGSTWERAYLPYSIVAIATGLSCPNASSCSILGNDALGNAYFLTTHDDGRTWRSIPAPAAMASPVSEGDIPFGGALSCTGASSCVIAGYVGLPVGRPRQGVAYVTTDSGRTWLKSAMPTGFVPFDLQCLSGGDCVSVGFEHFTIPSAPGAAAYSTDGGTTWFSSVLPSGGKGLTDLSCSNSGYCMTTGLARANYVTDSGGHTWSRLILPRKWSGGFDCVSSSHCWLAGGIVRGPGLVALTTDGGKSWQRAQLPSGVQTVSELSCPGASICFALDFNRYVSGLPRGSVGLLSYRR